MSKRLAAPFEGVANAELACAGERASGIENVQTYLTRFGYFPKHEIPTPNLLDPPTVRALERFQERHGLPISGEFDAPTRDQMATWRCGLPDPGLDPAFRTRCAWSTPRRLTYAFNNGTRDIAGGEEFAAVRRAFSTWAVLLDSFTFVEVRATGNPNVLIDWRPADDPDLDMGGGIIAHADFPIGCGVISNVFPRPLHFDDSENLWSTEGAEDAFDVETVALHELGHVLGLEHSTVRGAVMFPTTALGAELRTLQRDDIQGIHSLYPP